MSLKLLHKLTIFSITDAGFVPLSEGDFQRIRQAKKVVLFGLGLEEKLDLLLENYAEFERELLDLSLQHSIFPGRVESLLNEGIHLVNRRLANLLTTARLYLDQVLHDVSSVYGKESEEFDAVNRAINSQYKSNLGYRTMEALRNHVQHRSLPTHGISFPIQKDRSFNTTQLGFRVISWINLAVLEENPKFKKRVLAELKVAAGKKQQVSVVPFVREYVGSLRSIHEIVRKKTAVALDQADTAIFEYRKKAKEVFGNSLSGLAAVACDEHDVCVELEYVVARPIVRRKKLAEQNQKVGDIRHCYVSSIQPL